MGTRSSILLFLFVLIHVAANPPYHVLYIIWVWFPPPIWTLLHRMLMSTNETPLLSFHKEKNSRGKLFLHVPFCIESYHPFPCFTSWCCLFSSWPDELRVRCQRAFHRLRV